MFEEYYLVDFASRYQRGFRNNVVPVSEVGKLISKFKAFECYSTCFLYSDDILHYTKNNIRNGKPSVSGYDGKIWANFLPIDVDGEDLKEVLDITRQLADLFYNKWKVPRQGLNVYFSGAKGFHLLAGTGLFGNLEPSEDLHLIFSALRSEITSEIGAGQKYIDLGIKDKLRLFRLPSTVNGKTNLYKIQLTPNEVFYSKIDDILNKARKPRAVYYTDRTGLIPDRFLEPNKYLKELCEGVLSTVSKRFLRPEAESIAQPYIESGGVHKNFCKAKEKLWYSHVDEGNRNNVATRLVSEFRLSGFAKDQARDMMLFWNITNQIGLAEDEIASVVDSVYSSRKPYSYGCKDEVIRTFCPFKNKSECKHYRIYKAISLVE